MATGTGLLPQIEQQSLFSAINFSLCPADRGPGYAAMATAVGVEIGTLLCPSESASTQLLAISTGLITPVFPGYYSVSSYVGNYGGPAAIMPYSGTIIPGWDLEQGYVATTNSLPSVGIEAITDGTSNTALFSERLISRYPYITNGEPTKAIVYANEIAGLARSRGARRRAAKQRAAGHTADEQHRLPLRPGMPIDRLEYAGGDTGVHRHHDAHGRARVPWPFQLCPLDGPFPALPQYGRQDRSRLYWPLRRTLRQ